MVEKRECKGKSEGMIDRAVLVSKWFEGRNEARVERMRGGKGGRGREEERKKRGKG